MQPPEKSIKKSLHPCFTAKGRKDIIPRYHPYWQKARLIIHNGDSRLLLPLIDSKQHLPGPFIKTAIPDFHLRRLPWMASIRTTLPVLRLLYMNRVYHQQKQVSTGKQGIKSPPALLCALLPPKIFLYCCCKKFLFLLFYRSTTSTSRHFEGRQRSPKSHFSVMHAAWSQGISRLRVFMEKKHTVLITPCSPARDDAATGSLLSLEKAMKGRSAPSSASFRRCPPLETTNGRVVLMIICFLSK